MRRKNINAYVPEYSCYDDLRRYKKIGEKTITRKDYYGRELSHKVEIYSVPSSLPDELCKRANSPKILTYYDVIPNINRFVEVKLRVPQYYDANNELKTQKSPATFKKCSPAFCEHYMKHYLDETESTESLRKRFPIRCLDEDSRGNSKSKLQSEIAKEIKKVFEETLICDYKLSSDVLWILRYKYKTSIITFYIDIDGGGRIFWVTEGENASDVVKTIKTYIANSKDIKIIYGNFSKELKKAISEQFEKVKYVEDWGVLVDYTIWLYKKTKDLYKTVDNDNQKKELDSSLNEIASCVTIMKYLTEKRNTVNSSVNLKIDDYIKRMEYIAKTIHKYDPILSDDIETAISIYHNASGETDLEDKEIEKHIGMMYSSYKLQQKIKEFLGCKVYSPERFVSILQYKCCQLKELMELAEICIDNYNQISVRNGVRMEPLIYKMVTEWNHCIYKEKYRKILLRTDVNEYGIHMDAVMRLLE